MIRLEFLSLILWVSPWCQALWAQEAVGDTVIVVHETDLMIGAKSVQKVQRGVSLQVEHTADHWLWVSNECTGWIKKRDVATPSQAVLIFTEQIRQYPQDSEAYGSRGVSWLRYGNVEAAFADFNEALRINPRSSPSFVNRGLCWSAKGEFTHAIADYSEAIRIDPRAPLAYANRADEWRRNFEFDNAISDATDAIRLAPQFEFAYSVRAMACAAKKRFDNAIADGNEALRINPKGTSAYATMAWFLATCPNDRYRDGQKAIEFATKACEMAKWKCANNISTLAAACAEVGDFEKAVEWQTKAIEISPQSADSTSRLELYRSGKPFRDESAK